MRNSTIRWLLVVPGKHKLLVLALIITHALLGASGVVYALFLRQVVDTAVAGDRAGFWQAILSVALLMLAQMTLRAIVRWITELAKSNFENAFKARLSRTLLHGDYLRVSAVHSAEWLNRLTNDTVVVANGYTDIVPGLAEMVVKLVGALIMIIALQPQFAGVLIPGGTLLIIFTWLFRKLLKRMHKDVQEADGRLRILLQECMGSLLVVRSFAVEEQEQGRVEGLMREHKAARMRRNYFTNVCNIGFAAAMNGMYLLGIAWCGYGILEGTITFGTLTAITQLISQIQMPLANVTGYVPRYFAMIASAERLMEAESFESESTPPKPLSELETFYRKDLAAIGLRDASFSYLPASSDTDKADEDEMPIVLNGLSLEIGQGEYVAFTGHSGCGKSTALKLLMCVYQPDDGERYYVRRDGERAPLLAKHRRLFAYVPQGNALMSGTIREVVTMAAPEAAHDEERLTHALRVACAEEFVNELEDGPDTLLGERGCGLSEGQMQRLAIARAVFCGSPILLLDEATSALDATTERQVLQNLRAMTSKTVIIVTHRPAALDICDRVLAFTENGIEG